MDKEQAKQIYIGVREKKNAISLCYYLSSLDMETETAPRGCMDYRARQLSVLDGMVYDMTTAEDYRAAVEFLRTHADGKDPDFDREIEIVAREMDDIARVPKEEYLAYSELLTRAYPVYVEAKTESDYEKIAPYFEKIFAYNRRYAGWLARDGKVGYDVLLDQYEKDFTVKEYDRFFALLKENIVPLVAKIAGKNEPLPAFATKIYPAEGQKEFCEYLRRVMCFDPEYTAIMESEHPFTDNNGSHDVRITNHYYEDNVISSIFSAIHEMGHGLYELQVDPRFEGTACSGGTSLAVHESQSRLMENMIGRSRAFWETHFPKLREIFPTQLEGVTAEDFYRYVNRVECSLVRTEADELTYSLHVLIRYEIEKQLMAGTLSVAELPRVWNEKYREYLGVTPKDDKEGILQDMHWAGGSVGYFPTYALGSAYAAQIYAAMERDVDIDAALRTGTVRPLADWLKTHVHTYGSSRYPKELLKNATGEDFDPQYYVDYLTEKYTKLYNL